MQFGLHHGNMLRQTELEKQIAEVDGCLSSLGGSPDIAEKLLEQVRTIKQKTAILTDGSKREIIELLDTDVMFYTKDQAPWYHIEASFTVQRADLPFAPVVMAHQEAENSPTRRLCLSTHMSYAQHSAARRVPAGCVAIPAHDRRPFRYEIVPSIA
jgi:hypothetical protein